MGMTHVEDAASRAVEIGHLRGTWTALGEAAGSVSVGLRRIELPAGGWSTPAHEHGAQEEIFYVLAGRGLSWQDGRTAEIAAGDCIVYRPRRGAHTLHALDELDVLAFGPRMTDEGPQFPRLGLSFVGRRAVETQPLSSGGAPLQFLREAELGPPELPAAPDQRPAHIVNVDAVEPELVDRPRVRRERRDLGRAAASVATGLRHITVFPGAHSAPQHCHSTEEEIFVVLGGDGVLILGEGEHLQETAVRAGHVVARPAGTGVAHVFRAGDGGLILLAYGTRDNGDLCYYPRSRKVSFRGVGVIARIERLDYWDGED